MGYTRAEKQRDRKVARRQEKNRMKSHRRRLSRNKVKSHKVRTFRVNRRLKRLVRKRLRATNQRQRRVQKVVSQ